MKISRTSDLCVCRAKTLKVKLSTLDAKQEFVLLQRFFAHLADPKLAVLENKIARN